MIQRFGIGLVLTVIGIVGLIFLSGIIMFATADFRGTVERNERIMGDGDYRIAKYNQFYDLCSSIQSQQATIENQEEAAQMTDDPEQKQIYESGVLAAKNSQAENIAKYNSLATDSNDNASQFRDSGLPYQIENGENVTCGG